MSIQAKVTPIDQSISSAAAVEVPENGILKLSQSSNIALDVAPESVAGYSKSGSDLIVQLKTGESVRIANFYAEGQPSSQLFLADKDKLVAVDLPPVAADGPLMAGYIPQESLAGFESLTGAGVLGGMSAGTALLVGAAAIGAGVAISNSSGGGGGGGSSVPPDTTPPKAASGLKIAPDGSSISGQAEAGASVGIDTNGDGKPDLTVIADANGNFTAPLNPPLTNGQTVTVVVTDPAGNASPPAQVTAPDTTAPAPATDVQVTPGGSSVIGKAEPGSTVGVDTDGDGGRPRRQLRGSAEPAADQWRDGDGDRYRPGRQQQHPGDRRGAGHHSPGAGHRRAGGAGRQQRHRQRRAGRHRRCRRWSAPAAASRFR